MAEDYPATWITWLTRGPRSSPLPRNPGDPLRERDRLAARANHLAARGEGHGKALLQHLAGIAVENGYARVEWSVLDWNEPSINFYRRVGAVPMDGWSTFRLTGQALDRFGQAQSGTSVPAAARG